MQPFNPLVSIVIPVYNGSNYMKEAIDSALAQTYKNIEVIVVNDGSTDNTEQIALSYGDKIRYFSKENGGVATALNLAIEKAKGEYISWLSHDDVYYPNKIARQVEELAKLQDKNTILYSDWETIDASSHYIRNTNFIKTYPIHKLNRSLFPILKGIIHGCALLIPKIVFEQVGTFNPKLKTTQDYDLWFKMFPKYSLRFIPEPLIKSRTHDTQGSKIIPDVNKEANDLWIYMLSHISQQDMLNIEDSLTSFYDKTIVAMQAAQYNEVVGYLVTERDKHKQNLVYSSNVKVSVIIPFFNRLNYLFEAIKSAQSQTHTNLEIILINDNSTEDITSIKTYIKKDHRIVLINNTHTKGASGARNSGIEKATGDYIAFLDSDDIFLPEKLEKQLSYMIKNDLMITHTSFETFDGKKTIRKHPVGEKDFSFPEIMASCLIATPTVVVNSLILKNKRYRFIEQYEYGEDNCLWLDISQIHTIYGIKDVLVKVRKDGSNTTENDYKQLKGLTYIFLHMINQDNVDLYPQYLYTFSRTVRNILLSKIKKIKYPLPYRLKALSYRLFLRPILKIIFGKNKVKGIYDKRFL